MATIKGQEISRVTLSPNAETIIEYDRHQQSADILATGGDVYLTWRGSATVDGANCLKLTSELGYELRPKNVWNRISLISSAAAEVQVVVRNGLY